MVAILKSSENHGGGREKESEIKKDYMPFYNKGFGRFRE